MVRATSAPQPFACMMSARDINLFLFSAHFGRINAIIIYAHMIYCDRKLNDIPDSDKWVAGEVWLCYHQLHTDTE